jgi:hypothetical protein
MRKGRSFTPRQAGLFIRPYSAGESARPQEERNIITSTTTSCLSSGMRLAFRKYGRVGFFLSVVLVAQAASRQSHEQQCHHPKAYYKGYETAVAGHDGRAK